jgi:hypothetical protein
MLTPSSHPLLQNEILRRSSGVFQWVALVLVRALSQYMEGYFLLYIQERLRDTPTKLYNLYKNILLNFNNEDKQSRSFVNRTPQCQTSPNFIESGEQREKRLKSLSGGLAEAKIHQNEYVAQFIHQSVYDCLINEGFQIPDTSLKSTDIAIGRAHAWFSRSCVRYITIYEINQWHYGDEKVLEGKFLFFCDTL